MKLNIRLIFNITLLGIFLLNVLSSCRHRDQTDAPLLKETTFSTGQLKDKIKGGWAGQTIGVVTWYPLEKEGYMRNLPSRHTL
jgi:hypothetical protein